MIPTRIGNVAAAVVPGGLGHAVAAGTDAPDSVRAAELAARLDGLFAETWLAGFEPGPEVVGRRIGPAPAGLLDVLEAATAERVLVVEPVGPIPDVELLLALTAWPERPCVVLERPSGRPWCAIHLREIALARGRMLGDDPSKLLEDPEVERVDRRRLGLEDGGFC